jgi:hypothetical protein
VGVEDGGGVGEIDVAVGVGVAEEGNVEREGAGDGSAGFRGDADGIGAGVERDDGEAGRRGRAGDGDGGSVIKGVEARPGRAAAIEDLGRGRVEGAGGARCRGDVEGQECGGTGERETPASSVRGMSTTEVSADRLPAKEARRKPGVSPVRSWRGSSRSSGNEEG